MSAFLINDQMTCAIAYSLVKYQLAGFGTFCPAELAIGLRLLNLAALKARYGDDDHGNSIPLVEEPGALLLPLGDLAKAVSLLSYQCCEGNIPETSKVYGALAKAEKEAEQFAVKPLETVPS